MTRSHAAMDVWAQFYLYSVPVCQVEWIIFMTIIAFFIYDPKLPLYRRIQIRAMLSVNGRF